MSIDKTPKPQPEQQRDALAESERKSSEEEPRSYDERNLTDKIVHINPPEGGDAIKGLDPASPKK